MIRGNYTYTAVTAPVVVLYPPERWGRTEHIRSIAGLCGGDLNPPPAPAPTPLQVPTNTAIRSVIPFRCRHAAPPASTAQLLSMSPPPLPELPLLLPERPQSQYGMPMFERREPLLLLKAHRSTALLTSPPLPPALLRGLLDDPGVEHYPMLGPPPPPSPPLPELAFDAPFGTFFRFATADCLFVRPHLRLLRLLLCSLPRLISP